MSQINTSPVPAVISTQGPNFLPVPSLDPIASNTFISSFRLGLKSVPYTQAEGGDLFDPFMPLDTAEDDLDNIVRSTEHFIASRGAVMFAEVTNLTPHHVYETTYKSLTSSNPISPMPCPSPPPVLSRPSPSFWGTLESFIAKYGSYMDSYIGLPEIYAPASTLPPLAFELQSPAAAYDDYYDESSVNTDASIPPRSRHQKRPAPVINAVKIPDDFPVEYEALFEQMGWYLYLRHYYPVLCITPHNLPQGKPLNEWLDHNDNKSDDDPYHLPVSYYGYEERGPSFNFVTSTMWERIDEADVGAGSNPAKFHRKLLRWKEGVEMGFLTQSKMPADLVRGIEEAKEDLDEENKQRYHFLDGAKKAYVKKKRLEREKREPKVVKPKVIDPRDAYDYGFDTIIPPGDPRRKDEMRLYIPSSWTVKTNRSGRVFLCENADGVYFKSKKECIQYIWEKEPGVYAEMKKHALMMTSDGEDVQVTEYASNSYVMVNAKPKPKPKPKPKDDEGRPFGTSDIETYTLVPLGDPRREAANFGNSGVPLPDDWEVFTDGKSHYVCRSKAVGKDFKSKNKCLAYIEHLKKKKERRKREREKREKEMKYDDGKLGDCKIVVGLDDPRRRNKHGPPAQFPASWEILTDSDKGGGKYIVRNKELGVQFTSKKEASHYIKKMEREKKRDEDEDEDEDEQFGDCKIIVGLNDPRRYAKCHNRFPKSWEIRTNIEEVNVKGARYIVRNEELGVQFYSKNAAMAYVKKYRPAEFEEEQDARKRGEGVMWGRDSSPLKSRSKSLSKSPSKSRSKSPSYLNPDNLSRSLVAVPLEDRRRIIGFYLPASWTVGISEFGDIDFRKDGMRFRNRASCHLYVQENFPEALEMDKGGGEGEVEGKAKTMTKTKTKVREDIEIDNMNDGDDKVEGNGKDKGKDKDKVPHAWLKKNVDPGDPQRSIECDDGKEYMVPASWEVRTDSRATKKNYVCWHRARNVYFISKKKCIAFIKEHTPDEIELVEDEDENKDKDEGQDEDMEINEEEEEEEDEGKGQKNDKDEDKDDGKGNDENDRGHESECEHGGGDEDAGNRRDKGTAVDKDKDGGDTKNRNKMDQNTSERKKMEASEATFFPEDHLKVIVPHGDDRRRQHFKYLPASWDVRTDEKDEKDKTKRYVFANACCKVHFRGRLQGAKTRCFKYVKEHASLNAELEKQDKAQGGGKTKTKVREVIEIDDMNDGDDKVEGVDKDKDEDEDEDDDKDFYEGKDEVEDKDKVDALLRRFSQRTFKGLLIPNDWIVKKSCTNYSVKYDGSDRLAFGKSFTSKKACMKWIETYQLGSFEEAKHFSRQHSSSSSTTKKRKSSAISSGFLDSFQAEPPSPMPSSSSSSGSPARKTRYSTLSTSVKIPSVWERSTDEDREKNVSFLKEALGWEGVKELGYDFAVRFESCLYNQDKGASDHFENYQKRVNYYYVGFKGYKRGFGESATLVTFGFEDLLAGRQTVEGLAAVPVDELEKKICA